MKCGKRTNIFWYFLVGTTFLCCSLIIYQYLVFEGIICSHESSCFKSFKVKAEKYTNDECNSVCSTTECVDISNFILRNMNETADPCENFYNFACGNFNERFRRDGNQSVLDQLLGDLHKIIRDIIETTDTTPGSAVQKLKIVYESCMNTGSSELASVKSLLQFLKYMGIPNWPHLSFNFTFQRPTMTEVLGRLSSYQEDVFVRFHESYYDTSKINENLQSLTVSPQFSTFQDETEVKEVKSAVRDILDFTGMDINEINRTLEEFVGVDTEIYELFMNNSEWNIICEEENATEFNVLDCTHENNKNKHWLCRLTESVIRNGRISSRYSKDAVVIPCQYKYYIDKIFDLLNMHSERVIANYIALRVFINNLKYLDFSIRKNLKFFVRLPTDNEEDYITELDRWKFCVSWIADNMQYPLGMMYVSRMWPAHAADELNEIVQQLLVETKYFIAKQHWIGNMAKDEIAKEVDEEENCIYYVIEGMKNETKINALYKRFHPIRASFVRNVLSHKKFLFIASKLNPEEMNYFIEYRPFTVNAYGGDDIFLTFGILLPPVYQHGYPNLFNIAKIGQIIGHEIGHKLYYFFEHSVDLDNKTRENFNRKKRCLIDQYFNFEMKRIKKFVQGNLTISENFPDNLGIKVTEKVSEAYLRNMRVNRFTLPGLSYSPEELLYISYAQTWCTVRSIEKEKEHYERDFHSPPEFRIIGSLQNSERFSQVFNCPVTSFMNSREKCHIFE